MNPLARDPAMLTEFHERVARGDWTAARRLGLALQFHRVEPQRIFERDEAYLRRLARRYAGPARRIRLLRDK
jgi:hypothetical protein